MKRTVAICSSNYLPHLGGVEIYTQQLARKLSADCKVIIITMNTHNQPRFRMDDGIEVYSLPCISLCDGRLAIALPLTKRKVKEVFKDKKVDFVIIQTRLYPFSFLSAKLTSEMNLPAVIVEHGTGHVPMGVATQFSHFYEHILMCLIRHLQIPFAGPSKASCNWLKHFGIESDLVFYNSIDPELLSGQNNEGFRKRHGFSDDMILISFASRLIREKGILLLIQAFERIKTQYPNITLVIAGGGPLETEICKLAEERIVYLGRLSHKETIDMLIESNIFVLPTYFDAIPTVVLEAALCKCGIIATETGGIPEFITDKANGLLIPCGDVDALEAALHTLCADKALAVKYSEAAYAHAIEGFTWDITAKKVLSYIATRCNDK